MFKHIYGPVHSWRLGVSLGIDPVSTDKKICNLDCPYCQLGRTLHYTTRRAVYVSTKSLLKELTFFQSESPIDYLTFSGRGEPTLASNLGEMIHAVKAVRSEKIAVITNAVLLHRADVQKDLSESDTVVVKLDAPDEETFALVNKPATGIGFARMFSGIKDFRKTYRGRMALQIMFNEDNLAVASAIAELAEDIAPDEIQLNTPLRVCGVEPLPEDALREIQEACFSNGTAANVYDRDRRQIQPLNTRDTILRHGRYTHNKTG